MAARTQRLTCFILALVLSSGAAAQGHLNVSAQVLKHASVTLVSHPLALVITSDDVRRGYVDVSSPTEVAIRCNSLAGYLLEFAVLGDYVREVKVTGLARDVNLGPAGGVAVQAADGSPATGTSMRLGFRFMLADSARAGTYAWPMRLSVMPL